MPKTLSKLVNPERARTNFRHSLWLHPQLASRIIRHVDEGSSLVEGLQLPIDGPDVRLVLNLGQFAAAAPDIQAEMTALAREHLAEKQSTAT